MPFFSWKDEYSVGIVEIDLQHKQLIDSLNELHQAMTEGKGREVLLRVIDALVLSTQAHFKTEERLMESAGYPDLPSHRAKHEKIAQRLNELRRDFLEGRTTRSIQIANFFTDWLDKHVLEVDKRYAPFLQNTYRAPGLQI